VEPDKWKPIFGKNGTYVSQLIFDDGIDILIELTGHTAGNRFT
jgi:predicted O-linked N-acetylglucosamine transferase (SPINDLY family)